MERKRNRGRNKKTEKEREGKRRRGEIETERDRERREGERERQTGGEVFACLLCSLCCNCSCALHLIPAKHRHVFQGLPPPNLVGHLRQDVLNPKP